MLRTIAQDLSQLSLLPQPTTPQAIPSSYPHPCRCIREFAPNSQNLFRWIRRCYYVSRANARPALVSSLTHHASSIKHLSIYPHTQHTHTQHPSLKSRVSRIELMLSFFQSSKPQSSSSSPSLRIRCHVYVHAIQANAVENPIAPCM